MMATVLPYRFVEQLAALPFVERIWLFGSRARGDHGPRADIDLALWCPGASRQDWLQVEEILEEADTLLAIDCVRLDQAPEPLRANILAEGVVLHER